MGENEILSNREEECCGLLGNFFLGCININYENFFKYYIMLRAEFDNIMS